LQSPKKKQRQNKRDTCEKLTEAVQVYLIGCSHYNHNNIIKYCNRPFSDYKEMNEKMIEAHNSIVSKHDIFISLGDFSFNYDDKWSNILDRLNYRKAILIQGNHDKIPPSEMLASGFNNVFKKYWFNYHGYNILLTHKPCITDNMLKKIKNENHSVDYNISRSYEAVGQNIYDKMNINVHSHIHNNPIEQLDWTGKHFNASADVLNFTPIHIDKILEKVFNVKILKGATI